MIGKKGPASGDAGPFFDWIEGNTWLFPLKLDIMRGGITMRHSEFEIKAEDGIILFAREFLPETECVGVVCLVHGLGEHAGRYSNVADLFTQEGFAMFAVDLRGHGKSQGRRGHSPSYDTLLDDIARLLEESERTFPGKPVFLYGHSLGGNLVLNYVLRRRPSLAGVVVTSPWLRLTLEPPAYLIGIARGLAKIWPEFIQSNGLNAKYLSSDPDIVLGYEQDSLVHARISVRMFVEVTRAGRWAVDHSSQFSLPLLLMHGSGDRITSAFASQEFALGAGKNCTFKLWEGFFHELHNELKKEQVLKEMLSWLKDKTEVSGVGKGFR